MTTALFKKLNLGTHSEIHVLNAPASFEPELTALSGVRVQRTLAAQAASTSFAMAFVVTQAELDVVSQRLALACEGDAVLWMVYPKTTSKNYRCEFNRDSGWLGLAAAGFEPVRVVAIDADWSALRFRRVAHIKRMARDPSRAISRAGKDKSQARRQTLPAEDRISAPFNHHTMTPTAAQTLVVFAKNKKRVSAFYQQTLMLDLRESQPSHDLLTGQGIEIVVHAIPRKYATDIKIGKPPQIRADASFKPAFEVDDLARVRQVLKITGGGLKTIESAWHIRGATVLDGHDPEGNVVQFKQPKR
jgi:hypothetical protein